MIIKLTVTKRNNTIIDSEERTFDVDTIISPLRRDADDTYTYFTVRTNSPIVGRPGEIVNYQVDESLIDIEVMADELVLLSVTSRDGRSLRDSDGLIIASEDVLFNVNKVTEGFSPSGSGATFLYCEDNTPGPISYIVEDSVDDIIAETTEPGIGTVTGFSSGDASPLFTTSVATPDTTPALTFTRPTQTANKSYMGPANGAAAAPTFRALVRLDIPELTQVVNGAGTLNMLGTVDSYIFTGSTSTWTLQTLASSVKKPQYIKNRGTGTLTINSNLGATDIYDTAAVTTIAVQPGEAIILLYDGTYLNVH